MSKPKKKPAAKAKGKIKDLRSKKNPKGGGVQPLKNAGMMLKPQPLPPT